MDDLTAYLDVHEYLSPINIAPDGDRFGKLRNESSERLSVLY